MTCSDRLDNEGPWRHRTTKVSGVDSDLSRDKRRNTESTSSDNIGCIRCRSSRRQTKNNPHERMGIVWFSVEQDKRGDLREAASSNGWRDLITSPPRRRNIQSFV